MKKTKVIIPALGLLLLSTAASVTGTVAWFSANSTVTASNMQVKVKAEKGILINEVATAASEYWDDSATTSASPIQLRATSTANTSTWYTASSKKSSSGAGATAGTKSGDLSGDYATLSLATNNLVAASEGVSAQTDVGYVDDDGTTGYNDGEGYYVKYTYYIKSSSDAITCSLAKDGNNLRIKSVSATGNSTSPDLDKAIRVAVVVNSKAYIYAPIDGATTSYYVNASSTATAVLSGAQATSLTSIPAKTENGVAVNVYVYFEGEDANCKTDNITATLDTLNVTVQFELATNAAAATDNGVAVA